MKNKKQQLAVRSGEIEGFIETHEDIPGTPTQKIARVVNVGFYFFPAMPGAGKRLRIGTDTDI